MVRMKKRIVTVGGTSWGSGMRSDATSEAYGRRRLGLRAYMGSVVAVLLGGAFAVLGGMRGMQRGGEA